MHHRLGLIPEVSPENISKSIFVAVPEPSVPSRGLSTLRDRYHQITRKRDDCWNRWRLEYLNQLQVLSRWQSPQESLKEGAMVILKDEQAPPCKWLLARITQVFPDSESRVRRVTIRTSKGTLERPIHKLIPLPINPA